MNAPSDCTRELLAAAKQALESLKDLSAAYPNDPTFTANDGYADETMKRNLDAWDIAARAAIWLFFAITVYAIVLSKQQPGGCQTAPCPAFTRRISMGTVWSL